MKILIIVDYFSPKLGYSATFLAKEYLNKGHEVKVLTSNNYYPFENYDESYKKILGPRQQKIGENKEEGIPTRRGKMVREMFSRCKIRGIKKKIINEKPDLIIISGIASVTAIEVASLKHKMGFKLVGMDSHLMSVLEKNIRIKNIFYFIFRILFSKYIEKRFDKFIGVQEQTTMIINKYYGISKEKINFIPLGTDIEKFKFNAESRKDIRSKYNIPEASCVLIYTGKMTKDKGYDILIKATDKVMQEFGNVYLIIIGNGSKALLDEMKNYTKKWRKRYINIDFIKNNELYKYYSASDIGVRPLQESISMVEAAACNLPFIANDKIGTKLRISNNNALLYNQNYINDLAEKIEFLIDNKLERKKMGKRGRELVEQKLSRKNIAQKYLVF